MKDFSKEIQEAEQELARLNVTFNSLLRQLNISEDQLDELAEQAKREPMPKEYQEAWKNIQAEAKRAGEERAAQTSQNASTKKASSRRGIVRI